MGGKSGLRGRCVQPCRRLYQQQKHSGRAFSCLDLSLDVLVKTTLDMKHLASWKIEGRKKGPHYVYHVTTAFSILRDEGSDPQARREAVSILEMALGRPSTRAHFLPQRDSAPTRADTQTSSGLLIGKIRLDESGHPAIKPFQQLIPGDYLRIGYEDESWHATLPVTRRIPKAGTLALKLPRYKTPRNGTPVFLIDRREPELMSIIAQWQKRLEACKGVPQSKIEVTLKAPKPAHFVKRQDMTLRAALPKGTETRRGRTMTALWLSPRAVREISRTIAPNIAWWLPPVIWPSEEETIKRAIFEARRNGACLFVCNEPWQADMFPPMHGKRPELIAGPFCNLTNAYAAQSLLELGFSAAVASPELAREDFLTLPKTCPLPIGMVLSGFWPMGIGRHEPEGLRHNEPFQSPKGEQFWTRRYGQNTWIYPAWPLDLSSKRQELEAAGYSFFIRMEETPPKNLPAPGRPGLFNWDGALL